MSNFVAEKSIAAVRAVDEVRDGMLVGLGTGSTAAYAVKSLSERIKHGLRITAVATSQATEALALRLAVPLVPFQQLSAVDLTIDGASVDRLGGLCLQVLLSARRTWQADGVNLRLGSVSQSFADQWAAFGAPAFNTEGGLA